MNKISFLIMISLISLKTTCVDEPVADEGGIERENLAEEEPSLADFKDDAKVKVNLLPN